MSTLIQIAKLVGAPSHGGNEMQRLSLCKSRITVRWTLQLFACFWIVYHRVSLIESQNVEYTLHVNTYQYISYMPISSISPMRTMILLKPIFSFLFGWMMLDASISCGTFAF